MDEAKVVDRSGSVILEHLLLADPKPVPIKPNLDVKQILAVGSWYLWWVRRQFTHDGSPPPIANNFHQANAKPYSTSTKME